MNAPFSRRRFLRNSAAALAAPAIVPAGVFGSGDRPAASERITVGVVGCGARGFANLEELLKLPDCQVVGVCDVDTFHYREHTTRKGRPYGLEPAKLHVEQHYAKQKESGSEFKGVAAVSDYRELCSRDDIDAILVATPDHWHALNVLEALRAGKDVYCEKPVTHRFAEGQMIYREAAKREAIFQTGSQQRSEKNFHRAVEVVRNGLIGKVSRVEVGLPAGYEGPMGSTKEETPPAQLDYEMWTGPTKMMPYMRARNHRWWRGHSNYGGGNIMDWIGHHNDIAHWGMDFDQSGPLSVEAIGWTWPEGGDIYDCPVDYEIRCEYPGEVEWSISSKHKSGTKWIGEDGWVWVNRGAIEASDPWASGEKKGTNPHGPLAEYVVRDADPGPAKAYASPGHHRNFIDGIKSRKPCICPAETGHRSITPGHLAFVANEVGRKLKWDAKKETIVGDEAAQELLMAVPYREGWSLG